METERHRIAQFLGRIIKDWWILLGGFGPTLISWLWPYVATIVGDKRLQPGIPYWLRLGVVCIAGTIIFYRAWRSEHLEKQEFAEIVRPKLRLSFSIGDPGCVKRNIVIGDRGGKELKGTFYRVKVESNGVTQVNACSGRLRSIKRDGIEVFAGQPCRLPFTPSERSDAVNKVIHHNEPEYLDCILVTNDDKVFVWASDAEGKRDGKYGQLFEAPGDYELDISVLSDGPSIRILLTLIWRGSQQSAQMMVADALPLQD
jgi:hypothetical protein